jgi:hypothetical protein
MGYVEMVSEISETNISHEFFMEYTECTENMAVKCTEVYGETRERLGQDKTDKTRQETRQDTKVLDLTEK